MAFYEVTIDGTELFAKSSETGRLQHCELALVYQPRSHSHAPKCPSQQVETVAQVQ